MNAETTVEETVHASPLAKAIANGYVEAAAPSRKDRVAALVVDISHAMAHNAPVSLASFAEMKDLLGVKDDEATAEGPTAAAG